MQAFEPELFEQTAPVLPHPWDSDWMLRGLLARHLPESVLTAATPALKAMGELSAGELYTFQLADRLNEPVLTHFDAWGRRIDDIEITPLWRRAEGLAAEYGVVATGYESEHGAHARLVQFALAYLFIPSTDFYGCPLAMTDGAARVLADSDHDELKRRALPRLTSRDPATFWTSGQWMTELPGGSDVGNTETVAHRDETGAWRLYGRKWFTSATTSQMALTLARPEGNPAGSKGLALFYVEPRDEHGQLQDIEVLRLKDKLGTRKVPTAELMLRGLKAEPVAGTNRGVAAIAPMLNITRTWNAVTAVTLMRRGLDLAGDYAHKRQAFGKPIIEHPLHRRSLARLEARWAGDTALVFKQVRLLGAVEHGRAGGDLLRLMTPIVKLATGKHAIAVCSEVLECFGGAGYVENTGLPMLLRDAQVLSIWEGTTNVLALDTLRAISQHGPDAWFEAVDTALTGLHDHRLEPVVAVGREAVRQVGTWLEQSPEALEWNARDLALTLSDGLALALLGRHAQWQIDRGGDLRAVSAARLLATEGLPVADAGPEDCDDILKGNAPA